MENVPDCGVILACNHTSFADVLVLSAALRRQVRYMAKKELFKIPLLAPLIKALGAYPVDRGGADVGAIKKTIKMLGDGVSIGMFPQGHRQRGIDPRETEVKTGVAMVAVRAKATVLPCFIETKKRKWSVFCRVDVYVGKPIKFEELAYDAEASGEYARISNYIFDKICVIGENAHAE
jgi:1-acyl-sn-glycerol-3-phosphate acyltransferase